MLNVNAFVVSRDRSGHADSGTDAASDISHKVLSVLQQLRINRKTVNEIGNATDDDGKNDSPVDDVANERHANANQRVRAAPTATAIVVGSEKSIPDAIAVSEVSGISVLRSSVMPLEVKLLNGVSGESPVQFATFATYADVLFSLGGDRQLIRSETVLTAAPVAHVPRDCIS